MGDESKSQECQPPSWLDAPFIQEALHHGGENNLQVIDFTARVATVAGDNYASTLYRVKATIADGEERSLIIKVLPPGDMAQFVKDADFFSMESLMFKSILPKMEALLKTTAPGRFSSLSPRGLHYGSNPVDFLVVEDISPQGFKMVDRHKGMGLRHCLIALRTLARFHAASVALLEKDPSAANGLVNPFASRVPTFVMFSQLGPNCAAIACRSWSGFEEYAPLLDAFKHVAMDKYIELHEPKSESFNVLLHGDYWMNNMMFRYEDGQPVDVRVFDLQLSHVGPAALDVMYFLSCSTSEDVSTHHQDLLIREYYNALVEAMELLGLQPPSLVTILADLNSHGVYRMMPTFSLLPFTKAKNLPDMDDVVAGDPETVRFLFEDPVVKRWLQRIIPEYRRNGWLPG